MKKDPYILKEIVNIKSIYELLLKSENVDSTEFPIKSPILDRINNHLKLNKAKCLAIFENNKPIAFLYGLFFNKNNGFMVNDYYVGKAINNDLFLNVFITSITELIKTNKCKYFRMFPKEEFDKSIASQFLKNEFYLEKRLTMEYDLTHYKRKCNIKKKDSIFYNINDHLTEYEFVENNSFKNSLDSILFPETTESRIIEYNDTIDPKYSPYIMVNKNIIGVSSVSKSGNKVEIESIAVLKNYQGDGYGKLLMSEILNNSYNNGVKSISLTVTEKNKIAVNLYKKLGFEITSSFNVVTYTNNP